MKALQLFVVSVTILAQNVAVSQKAASKCYYPNGNEARGDSPCNPDADGPSFCCNGEKGYVCMNNKYCRGPRDELIRGSCTDPSFPSSGCPKPRGNGTPGDIVSCSNVTGTDTSFCCPGNAGCCNSGNGRFEVLPSQPFLC